MASLIVRLKERVLFVEPITAIDTLIGRDDEANVTLDNVGVSRIHAVLRYDAGCFVVIDNDSANGIFIGEDRMTEAQIDFGEQFDIGKYCLELSREGGVPPDQLAPSDTAKRLAAKKQARETLFMRPGDLAKLREQRSQPVPIIPMRNVKTRGGFVAVLIVLLLIAIALAVIAL